MVDEPTKKPPDAPVTSDTDPVASAADSMLKPRTFETSGETSSMEEYLYGKGLYAKGADQLTWGDRTRTRVAIRLVSRGIFGALAFAFGGRYARTQLRDYHPEDWTWNSKKPLQALAKGFDTIFGKPIQMAVRSVAGQKAAEDATWFRSKAYHFSMPEHSVPPRLASKMKELPLGRSLGAEMVSVSFDFSCASAADAFTRNIIQVADPNIKKPWLDDHGKFDGGKLVKYVGATSWRILTKNAGEDWGAALPYVYQMKLQRRLIAKWYPGSKLFLDHGWNGGSYELDKQGKIVGDYQWPGALDLQGRFVGYNWHTLMYREGYDAIGRHLKQWKDHGFAVDLKSPEHPVSALVGGARDGLRYVIKSFIKANLYMQPAVPFFWLFRTPQTKWRAGPINPDSGYTLKESTRPYDKFDNNRNRLFQGGTNITKHPKHLPIYFHEKPIYGHELGNFDPYAAQHQKTLFSKILNPFGKISYVTGTKLMETGWGGKLITGSSGWLSKVFGESPFRREEILRGIVDASFSYTPYMIAKAELGLRVDDRPSDGSLGKMDKAIYKAMDSLSAFKFKEFGQNIGEIKDLIWNNFGQNIATQEGGLAVNAAKADDNSVIPKLSTTPSARVEKSTITDEHRAALTPIAEPTLVDKHREALSGERKPATKNWSEYLGEKKKNAQLLASHPTVQ
ncbi:MAG: hypothetical protein ACK5R4_02250 [Alphaproteobacteria bacterium]|jgi:hypothetical protein